MLLILFLCWPSIIIFVILSIYPPIVFIYSFHVNSSTFWLFVIPYIFVHCFTSFWYIVFNKFQSPVWGYTEIPGGECHRCRNQVTKFGLCIALGENRFGMPAYVQACHHDSTGHVQSFFHPEGKADDCDIITWWELRDSMEPLMKITNAEVMMSLLFCLCRMRDSI